jgi:conjugative transfer region protein TrbK
MKPYLTPRQFAWAAAIAFGVVVVAVAVIQSRHGDGAAILAPLGRSEADALVSGLARCRSITPDDTAVLEACRRIWDENRQHFFASTKSRQPPAAPVPNASAEIAKSQDRVLPYETEQGRAR